MNIQLIRFVIKCFWVYLQANCLLDMLEKQFLLGADWSVFDWLISKYPEVNEYNRILSLDMSGVTWAKSYKPFWTFFSSQSAVQQRAWGPWCDHVSSSSHTWYGCAQVIILKGAFRRNISFNPLKSGYRWNVQTCLFSSSLQLLP